MSGFEALLRWNHPERGLITPDDFIPLAEETGLIVPIGEWVLRQACAEAAGWPEQVKVAVNLSAAAVQRQQSGRAGVQRAQRVAASPPAGWSWRSPKSALLENSESAFATLQRLRDMGVRISLDDFGIGYSCLSYLRRFPFDKIKIDRSFIRDMGSDQQSVAIIQAVIGLGASLDMETVAEGVETRDELDCLRAFGCTEVQGYYHQPAPACRRGRPDARHHSRQDRARRLSADDAIASPRAPCLAARPSRCSRRPFYRVLTKA